MWQAWRSSRSGSPTSSAAISKARSPCFGARRAVLPAARGGTVRRRRAGLVAYADVLINDLAAGGPITPNRLRPRLVVDRPR